MHRPVKAWGWGGFLVVGPKDLTISLKESLLGWTRTLTHLDGPATASVETLGMARWPTPKKKTPS